MSARELRGRPAACDAGARTLVTAYWAELGAALRDALSEGPQLPDDPAEVAEVDRRARTLAGLTTSARLLARGGRAEFLAFPDTASALVRSWFDHRQDLPPEPAARVGT